MISRTNGKTKDKTGHEGGSDEGMTINRKEAAVMQTEGKDSRSRKREGKRKGGKKRRGKMKQEKSSKELFCSFIIGLFTILG